MSFLSVAFLAGLVSVAAPILIHLIQRQRYPERKFSTLRFFDKTIKNNTIRRRIIDKILLALRIAALAALMFGLARPFWSANVGEERMSLVIVLDNSPSMGRMVYGPAGGKTLFEQGRHLAEQIVEKLGPSDRAELILTSQLPNAQTFDNAADVRQMVSLRQGRPTALKVAGDTANQHTLPEFTSSSEKLDHAVSGIPSGSAATLYDLEPSDSTLDYVNSRLQKRLAGAVVSAQPGKLGEALTRAQSLLQASSDGTRKIIVLSDMQKSEVDGMAPMNLGATALTIVPLDIPPEAGANLGVESCSVPREADFGQTAMGTAVVRNYSKAASEAAKLVINAGDRTRPVDIVLPAIPPEKSLIVSFPIRVMTSEPTLLCSAQIQSRTDPFPYDDTWYFQLAVRYPVTTMCVNGLAGATSTDRKSFFVMNALVPRGASSQVAGADAREVELADLKDQRMTEFRVLILCGAPALQSDQRERIRQFAADGKSVLIFPSMDASPEEMNGWEFLPARVESKDSQNFVFMQTVDGRAAAVSDVAERAGPSVHALSTRSHFKLVPNDGAQVLATFSDNSPALVEAKVGKGRVIMAAAAAHSSESDWPLRPAFVLLMRNLVKYLGSDGKPLQCCTERTVGEAAATLVAKEYADGTPSIFRVSAEKNVYEPELWARSSSALLMPPAQASGQYLLSVQPGQVEGVPTAPGVGAATIPVSFNHSTLESTLAAVPPQSIARALAENGNVTVVAGGDDAGPIVSELYTGRELWRWAVIGALAFLVIEQLLAWKTNSEAAS